MLKRGLILCCLTLLALNTLTYAADWPRFMGPDGSGISAETGLNKDWKSKKPKILWKVPLYNAGYSGPSVANNMVFLLDRTADGNQDQVNAYNLSTGKLLWKYAYDDSQFENYGFGRATPTYDNGKVYTMSMMGVLHCLDAKTGKKLWMVDTRKQFKSELPGWQLAGSPVVDGDKLLICPSQPTNLVALDKSTGKTIWKGGSNELAGYATPVIATLNGSKVYVYFTGKSVIGANPENGKVVWRYPWVTEYDANVADPIIYGENQVFITSGYGHGCAMLKVDPAGTVKVLWENTKISAHFSSPVLYQNYIYGNNDADCLVCLDPKTGKVCWQQEGFEKGGQMIADGVILAFEGDGGDLVMCKADPTAYGELGRLKRPLGGQSWTAPVLADGKLIIRNREFLACIDLK